MRELYPAARLAVGCAEVTIERRLSQGVPRRAYLSAASAAELHAVEDGAGRQSSTCVLKSRPCRASTGTTVFLVRRRGPETLLKRAA